jgi:hypothetical protein
VAKPWVSLRPAEDVVEDVHYDERERVECVGDDAGPERERGPEAGEEGHDDTDEHLRREVPCQLPEVDERQEHAQAQRVVHRHAAVHL